MKELHLKSELFKRVLGLVFAVFLVVSTVTILMFYQFSKAGFLTQNARILTLMNQQTHHFLQHPKEELRMVEAALAKPEAGEGLEDEILFILERFDYLYRVERMDGTGQILETFPRDARLAGLDYSQNPVFTAAAAMAPGTFVYGNTFIDPVEGFSSVSMSMKSRDGSVLVGYINLERLQEAIAISEAGQLTYAVLDENGYYILHPDRRLVIQRELNPDFIGIRDGRLEEGDLVVHQQGRTFIQFQEIASTGWTLLLYQDVTAMIQPIFLSLLLIVLAFFVFGALIALSVKASLGKVESALLGFIQMTKDVSVGRYAMEDQAENYVEFKELAMNFEKMMAEVEIREEKIRGLNKDLEANYLNTVVLLSNTIEAKDSYTGNHCERVRDYAMMIGRQLKLDEGELAELSYGSQLHDLGKLSVPEAILTKPGRLSQEEYALIRRHSEFGYALLKELPAMEKVKEIVLYHHERYDGKGYPKGLKGEEIPLLARIVAIADAFDAMTSERVYRARPMTEAQALEELKRNRDLQFDGRLADLFIASLASHLPS